MHPRYEGCRAAAAQGLAERSSVLAGDFFASVPEADLYLLKHVLHDGMMGSPSASWKTAGGRCGRVGGSS